MCGTLSWQLRISILCPFRKPSSFTVDGIENRPLELMTSRIQSVYDPALRYSSPNGDGQRSAIHGLSLVRKVTDWSPIDEGLGMAVCGIVLKGHCQRTPMKPVNVGLHNNANDICFVQTIGLDDAIFDGIRRISCHQ